MKLDKKTFKMILSLAILVMLFAWFIGNIGDVMGFMGKVANILKPLFLGFIIAFLLNIILNPLERLWNKLKPKKKLSKLHSRLKRPVCIVLSLIIAFGVVSAIIFIVVPELTRTIMSFAEKIPQYAQTVQGWWTELSQFLANHNIEMPGIEVNTDEIVGRVTDFIAEKGGRVLDSTIGFTANIVSELANFFIAVVFSVYILAQKENFYLWSNKFVVALFSAEWVNSIRSFFTLVNKTFTKFVSGQLTEAVALGSMCFVGMLVLRMPYAPIISALVGFMALIPIFGAWIATIIGVLLIALDSPMQAVWFVVFILVLQWFDGNFVYPKIVGKSVGLPPLFVLLAVTIGGSAFGIVGMLVSVPTVSVFYTLITTAVDNRLKAKNINEKDMI